MKRINIFIMLLFLLPIFMGCEDENRVVLDLNKSTPAEITSPTAGTSFELLAENADELIKLKFTPAVFELNVATEYTLELSSTKDFLEGKVLESNIDTKIGEATLKTVVLNKALLAKEYEPVTSAPVYLRLITRVLDSDASLHSNILNIEVIPYKIASDGSTGDGSRIYIVGAGVPAAGWEPTDAVELVNIAPDVYRATVEFVNDRFRFLAQQAWGDDYNFPYFSNYVSNLLENALQPDREDGDENFWFKGGPGIYVVTVDLDKKTVEIDKPYSDDNTRVYLVGAAVVDAQWEPGDAVEMVNIAPNRYRATTDFAIERFRFLGQQAWDGTSYNFPFFISVPEKYFENARQSDREDGDENLWFKGPNGTYTITIDIAEKWITMY